MPVSSAFPVTIDDVRAHLAHAVDLTPEYSAERLDELIVDGLEPAGVEPGEIVLIESTNGTALLRCFYGVLFAGAVPALLAPGTPAARIREIAERFGARTLLTLARIPQLEYTDVTRLGPLCLLRLSGIEPHRHTPGDVVILTSGTSGAASGCLHRWSSLLRNGARHAASVGLRDSDSVLVNLPLNFSYALVAQAMASLQTGARLVITGPPFSPRGYTEALARHQITSSSLTPFMVRHLLRGDWRPPPTLRMLSVGGESIEPAAAETLLGRRAGLELYLTYGLTEAGPRVSTLAAHLEPAHRLASVGRALSGVQVSLRNVGPDGVGELLVTSDTVLRRGIGVAEGRAGACLVGPDQIATGDLFTLDDEGYLFFRGRLSDFVISGGMKVSLASVRRIANSLPNVVTSVTRSYGTEQGTRFDLDLYLRDTGADAVAQARRALLRQLVRAERPHRIRALSIHQMGHK
ncbi:MULTISPECIES: class I adenylate-forming enzyme family protein [unclassified Micromonospora]|uniref:class I adenylate-forming enzyme family protein n=1 Tax=unclassified Micromonospora TaxID=2617518 RepID=UPI003A87EA23